MPENNDGDMLPIYEGFFEKEYNEIDLKEAVEIIAPPRVCEQPKITLKDMIKTCNTCNVMLTEDNKIKGKRICKNCNNNKRHPKKYLCNTCEIELNDNNKIKGKRICKRCNNIKRFGSKI